MKVNKYDFYSTVIGILLFIVVAALVALIMSCGTTYQSAKWDYDAPAGYVKPKPCDHFYINKSKLTSDPKIIGETVPCICIYCKDIQTCKNGDAYDWGQLDMPLIVTTPMPFRGDNQTINIGCQHTSVMRTMAGCSPPSNKCNTCTCMDCGYSYNCN